MAAPTTATVLAVLEATVAAIPATADRAVRDAVERRLTGIVASMHAGRRLDVVATDLAAVAEMLAGAATVIDEHAATVAQALDVETDQAAAA